MAWKTAVERDLRAIGVQLRRTRLLLFPGEVERRMRRSPTGETRHEKGEPWISVRLGTRTRLRTAGLGRILSFREHAGPSPVLDQLHPGRDRRHAQGRKRHDRGNR